MNTTELTALLVYATAMSFSPGPNNALAAAIGSRHGLPAAMRFLAGVPVGWCLLILISAAGIGVGLDLQAAGRRGLLLLAVAYVLWLASRLWQRDKLADPGSDRLDVGFVQGVGLQFVNGKAWLNAVTVSATWVSAGDTLVPRLGVVLPIMAAFAFASNFTYAVIGSSLRSWLSQGRRLVNFNRGLSVLLVLTACWMAWSSGVFA